MKRLQLMIVLAFIMTVPVVMGGAAQSGSQEMRLDGIVYIYQAGQESLVKKIAPELKKYALQTTGAVQQMLDYIKKNEGIDFKYHDRSSGIGAKLYSELTNLLQVTGTKDSGQFDRIWTQSSRDLIVLHTIPRLTEILGMNRIRLYTIRELKDGKVPYYSYEKTDKNPVEFNMDWQMDPETGRLRVMHKGKVRPVRDGELVFPYFVDYQDSETAWLKRIRKRYGQVRQILEQAHQQLAGNSFFSRHLSWEGQLRWHFIRTVFSEYMKYKSNIQDPLLEWWFAGMGGYWAQLAVARYFGPDAAASSPGNPVLIKSLPPKKGLVLSGWANTMQQPMLLTDVCPKLPRLVYSVALFHRIGTERGEKAVLGILRRSLELQVLHLLTIEKLVMEYAGFSTQAYLNRSLVPLTPQMQDAAANPSAYIKKHTDRAYRVLYSLLAAKPRDPAVHKVAAEAFLKVAANTRDFDRARYAVNHMLASYYLSGENRYPVFDVPSTDPFLWVVYAQFLRKAGAPAKDVHNALHRALNINPHYQPARYLLDLDKKQR